MTHISVTGGCACGAIRYEFAGEFMLSLNCHCRDCQRETGGAYAPIMIVPVAGFTVTRGAPKKYEVLADRGSIATRWHCGDCGSPLYGGGDETMNLRAGSFDDPSLFEPTMDIYTSKAQPWDVMNPSLRKFPKLPIG